MGFADLSIAEIAAEYDLPAEDVFYLCQQLGITYKTQETRLALEDAKAIISKILSKQQGSASPPSKADLAQPTSGEQ
ncbi:MAG TPA: translation initiation factor IF-2 [Allocoleopsis sp.]